MKSPDKKKGKELTCNKHVTKVYQCDMSESKEPVKRILIKTRSTGKTMIKGNLLAMIKNEFKLI